MEEDLFNSLRLTPVTKIRRVLHSKDVFNSDNYIIPSSVFELTSEDKKDDEPHLSVWDVALIDFDGCNSFMTIKQGVLYCADLQADVIDVESIIIEGFDDLNLIVKRVIASQDKLGRSAHCGIFGLKRPPNVPKDVFRDLRVRLSKVFKVIYVKIL